MDRRQTTELKGAALILMFWHHLFGCSGFLVPETYNWTPVFGQFDLMLATKGKLALPLFVVASGYGLYYAFFQKEKEGIWKRIAKFLITYWTIMFLVAIPYLFLKGRMDWQWLPANLVALYHNDSILYVTLSWYVKVYLEILLILPLVRKLQSRMSSMIAEVAFFVLLPLVVARLLPDAESIYVNFATNLLSSLRLLLVWYPVFHMGLIAAKYKLVERFIQFVEKHSPLVRTWVIPMLLGMIGMVFSLWLWNGWNDFFCAFLFLHFFALFVSYCRIEPIHAVLEFLGRYSFQYWLLSGMFFVNTSDYLWVLFLPRYSVLICIWSLLILTPFAFSMEKLSGWVYSGVLKVFSRSDERIAERKEGG